MTETCPICGGGHSSPGRSGRYLACGDCGHEWAKGVPLQTFMINDALVSPRRGPGFLVRHQIRTLLRFGPDRQRLLDVGSGSGYFLNFVQPYFEHVQGIEISERPRKFAQDTLGLDIVATAGEAASGVTAMTFWHSLEHIPGNKVHWILDDLCGRLAPGAMVIVCVPNAGSICHRLLAANWAYFDAENHPHQFSARSLDLLMSQHGFVRCGERLSLPYVLFGIVQSLLNLIVAPHNYLYEKLKRGTQAGAPASRLVLSMMALPVATAIAALMMLAEACVPGKREVITRCYRVAR